MRGRLLEAIMWLQELFDVEFHSAGRYPSKKITLIEDMSVETYFISVILTITHFIATTDHYLASATIFTL